MLLVRQLARGFEQNDLALDVGLDIGERLGQRVSHSRLGGEVDDRLDIGMALDQRGQRRRIGDIDRLEGKSFSAFEPRQPGVLQCDIVIGVEVVDADDPLAAIEQVLRDMKPDKARAARDQEDHLAIRTGSAFCRRTRRAAAPA
jgi:hypothetical protein